MKIELRFITPKLKQVINNEEESQSKARLMDFKIPKPILPTDEEMREAALEWKKKDEYINMPSWSEKLRQFSYPFYAFPLSKKIMDCIVEYENPKNKELAYELVESEFAEKLKKLGLYDKHFMKLISRSPKDYTYDENNFGKPTPMSGTRGIVDSTRSSMRTFDDMCLLRYIPEYAQIIFRPYVDFHPSTEWRVFVYGKTIMGISQYYYDANFKYTKNHISVVDALIRKFAERCIYPNPPIDTYVFDVVCDGRETTLLEINPWGLSDPCLFKDYKSWDGTLRYNKLTKQNA